MQKGKLNRPLSEAELAHRRKIAKQPRFRRKTGYKKVLVSQYKVPSPHSKQAEILKSPAKRKVVITGRRFGKTIMTGLAAYNAVRDGRKVIYCAPLEKQTKAFWRYICNWFNEEIVNKTCYINYTTQYLELGRGSVIALTARDPNSLRGDYADLLILDEFAYLDPEVWEEVGRFMTLDTDGDVYFISTPFYKNHAYRMYLKAKNDTTGRWKAWHGTTFDNPHLSKEAIDEILQDQNEDSFRQEAMAEFLDNSGNVFRNIGPNLYEYDLDEHKGHRLVAGVDWGRKRDYTCISIGCANCHKEVFLERFNRYDYPAQLEFIKEYVGKWHPELLAEANSMGQANIDQLQNDGIEVLPFNTTNASKSQIIRQMQLVLEQSEWKWLNTDWARDELESYEMKVNTYTNLTQYSAPEGLHDDSVIARCLMLHQALCGQVTLIAVEY